VSQDAGSASEAKQRVAVGSAWAIALMYGLAVEPAPLLVKTNELRQYARRKRGFRQALIPQVTSSIDKDH
jgi:hypothetical protein